MCNSSVTGWAYETQKWKINQHKMIKLLNLSILCKLWSPETKLHGIHPPNKTYTITVSWSRKCKGNKGNKRPMEQCIRWAARVIIFKLFTYSAKKLEYRLLYWLTLQGSKPARPQRSSAIKLEGPSRSLRNPLSGQTMLSYTSDYWRNPSAKTWAVQIAPWSFGTTAPNKEPGFIMLRHET